MTCPKGCPAKGHSDPWTYAQIAHGAGRVHPDAILLARAPNFAHALAGLVEATQEFSGAVEDPTRPRLAAHDRLRLALRAAEEALKP